MALFSHRGSLRFIINSYGFKDLSPPSSVPAIPSSSLSRDDGLLFPFRPRFVVALLVVLFIHKETFSLRELLPLLVGFQFISRSLSFRRCWRLSFGFIYSLSSRTIYEISLRGEFHILKHHVEEIRIRLGLC